MDPMFPGGPPQFILVPPGSVPVPIINQMPVMMQPTAFPVYVQQPTGQIPVMPTSQPPPTTAMSTDFVAEDRLQEKARR